MKNSEINIDVARDTVNGGTNSSIGVSNDWISGKVTVDSNDQIEKIINDDSTKKLEDKFRREFWELRNNLITLFSILASVIAFLFAEIQLLKNLCSWQGISWFTLILLWSLSLFLLLIKIFLSSKDKIKFDCPSIILLVLIIFILVVWIWLSSKWNEIKCKNEVIIQEYQENLYEEIDYKIEKKIKTELNNVFHDNYLEFNWMWDGFNGTGCKILGEDK